MPFSGLPRMISSAGLLGLPQMDNPAPIRSPSRARYLGGPATPRRGPGGPTQLANVAPAHKIHALTPTRPPPNRILGTFLVGPPLGVGRPGKMG
eukprot:8280319-Pyramimonas_sp.AAC.1